MTIVIDIRKKVNTIYPKHIEPYLYLTDTEKEAQELTKQGHFVLPILNDDSSQGAFWDYKYIITNPDDVDDDYYLKVWQRLSGQPWDILKTDRCIIREMTTDDLSELYALYSDPEITKYTEPLFPEYEDEFEYTINYINNVYSYFGFGTWIIIDKKTNRIVGRAGFNYRPGFELPELGFVIGKRYWRQGYAYEVCQALIDYGYKELEFKKIQALVHPDNTASIGLLNKLSFYHTGSFEQYDIYIR